MTEPFDKLKMVDVQCTGVIQVGANVGQEVSLFQQVGLERAILIEPLQDNFEALSGKLGGAPGYVPVQALCTDKDDDLCDFHVSTNPGAMSSSVLPPGRHLDLYPKIRFPTVLQIKSVTLDTLIDRLAAQGLVRGAQDYDLLVLDTQGSEFLVMQGAQKIMSGIKAIWTEVNQGGLYQGDVRFADMIAFLDRQGFDLYLVSINGEGWGDALFVRKSAARATRPGVGAS